MLRWPISRHSKLARFPRFLHSPIIILTNTSQGWYWHRASDPGSRARATFGDDPEEFDVKGDQATDLFLIQMGGNDHRHPNEIPGRNYYHAYVELINDLHSTHPHATVLLVVRLIFRSPILSIC